MSDQRVWFVDYNSGGNIMFRTEGQAEEYARLTGNGPVYARIIPSFDDGESILDQWRDSDEEGSSDFEDFHSDDGRE